MLHVTDNRNHCIQMLDQDGKYVREYGQKGVALDNSSGQPLYMLTVTMSMPVRCIAIVCMCLLLVVYLA